MADFNSGIPEYVPLWQNNNNRRNCSSTERLCVFISVFLLTISIFCAINMLMFGFYEKISYPRHHLMEVPHNWFERAITYNSGPDGAATDYSPKSIENRASNHTYKLVCYYNFPSTYRGLQVDNIDPFLCTHINVAFATVVNCSLYLNWTQRKVLENVVALKTINENLKVLISVGGARNSVGFPEMIFNHTNRKMFIKSILTYIKVYDIDGVDLDWEFPGEYSNGDKKQRMHFTQLLEEIRMTINRQRRHTFLLSVAVGAPIFIVDNSYDVSYMNQFVDFINLMTYDYHFYTTYTPFSGLNAPLYRSDNENGYLSTLNINFTTNYWNFKGMDREKIIVGLPTYGHSFTLINVDNNGLYAPSKGYGKLGENGFFDYNQLCTFLTANQITPIFEMETKSPYAVKSTEWVSFDDEQSLSYKTEFVKNNNFGGVMVLSLNTDDHWGSCKMNGNNQKFPLTKKIRQVLNS